jgi:hypothetical protein
VRTNFVLFSALILSVASSAHAVCPTPASVQNFQPPAYIPPIQQNVCSMQQISDYYSNCLDPMQSSQMKCTTYTTNNKTCASCLDTPKMSNMWGALVQGNGVVSINVAGCADIQGYPNCAKAYEAAQACESAACDQVCPVMDQQSFMAWQQCVQTADAGGCASFVNAKNNACQADAGNLAQCFNFMSFQAGYQQLAPMFCASGMGGMDAGATDSGSPPDDSGTGFDSGSTGKPDSGSKSDSGASGADAGDDFIPPNKGCHCNEASGSTGVGESTMVAFAVASILRARLKRKR